MREVLKECASRLSEDIANFPWEDRAAYADWLTQTYYYVSHSTRLLATAAARFDWDDRGSALHHRFAAHIAEEKRHEALALHDLKQLGVPLGTERLTTRMFYEPQYYKIERQRPISLFGYILPLEAIGPLSGKLVIHRVTAAFGEKCAAFLKLHTEDDVEHLEKAFQFLNGISREEAQLVEIYIRQTAFAYRAMLTDIRTTAAS